ncbi:MAG: hypothetical protein JXO22_07545 [Phycisphaerae bacterium]|nr:hypothetical protein [Phycisphaerae bacterium]
MTMHRDPVDVALETLRGQRWPGDQRNIQLENKLMREFDKVHSDSRGVRRRLLMPALVIVALGGVSLAAAGGYAVIKGWLITTEVNGQVVDVREVTPDADGGVSFTLPDSAIQPDENGMATIGLSVDSGEATGAGTQTMVSVELTDDGGPHIKITPTPVEDDGE